MKEIEWLSTQEFLPPQDVRVLVWDGQEIQIASILWFYDDDGKPYWSYYDCLELQGVKYFANLPDGPT